MALLDQLLPPKLRRPRGLLDQPTAPEQRRTPLAQRTALLDQPLPPKLRRQRALLAQPMPPKQRRPRGLLAKSRTPQLRRPRALPSLKARTPSLDGANSSNTINPWYEWRHVGVLCESAIVG